MRLSGLEPFVLTKEIPFVNVGERTNVTGSAKFRKLITNGDYAAALDVARDQVPVWPILKQEAGSYEVFAYAFESIDLAPIPGFGGTPPDLLIALAPDGTFREVKVIAHHEPVFLEGLGSEPLFAFVEQYVGLSARQPIRVGRPNARGSGAAPQTTVDGISMATASTRVINESILAASLAVARAKLGFGAPEAGG